MCLLFFVVSSFANWRRGLWKLVKQFMEICITLLFYFFMKTKCKLLVEEIKKYLPTYLTRKKFCLQKSIGFTDNKNINESL